MTTPRSKIWFYEFRPNGPRAAESTDLHNQILDAWAAGATKAEIARMLQIDRHTVRKVTWKARRIGDPRGFAQTKPILLSMGETSQSVLDVYQEQWVVRGLAKAFEIPHASMEAILRNVVEQAKKEEAK